jgi:hypothetical protein
VYREPYPGMSKVKLGNIGNEGRPILPTRSVARWSAPLPSNPMGSGFIASLAWPGGNITDVLHYEVSTWENGSVCSGSSTQSQAARKKMTWNVDYCKSVLSFRMRLKNLICRMSGAKPWRAAYAGCKVATASTAVVAVRRHAAAERVRRSVRPTYGEAMSQRSKFKKCASEPALKEGSLMATFRCITCGLRDRYKIKSGT